MVLRTRLLALMGALICIFCMAVPAFASSVSGSGYVPEIPFSMSIQFPGIDTSDNDVPGNLDFSIPTFQYLFPAPYDDSVGLSFFSESFGEYSVEFQEATSMEIGSDIDAAAIDQMSASGAGDLVAGVITTDCNPYGFTFVFEDFVIPLDPSAWANLMIVGTKGWNVSYSISGYGVIAIQDTAELASLLGSVSGFEYSYTYQDTAASSSYLDMFPSSLASLITSNSPFSSSHFLYVSRYEVTFRPSSGSASSISFISRARENDPSKAMWHFKDFTQYITKSERIEPDSGSSMFSGFGSFLTTILGGFFSLTIGEFFSIGSLFALFVAFFIFLAFLRYFGK